jgi:hypothetical protein
MDIHEAINVIKNEEWPKSENGYLQHNIGLNTAMGALLLRNDYLIGAESEIVKAAVNRIEEVEAEVDNLKAIIRMVKKKGLRHDMRVSLVSWWFDFRDRHDL